ncbi:MAG: bifunctional DNA-formamidopyrimidine glycosylase/DNA-(apurinic or apyrimidinic site) lyase [Rhodocyclaceae bacterium]|nr:bifunctional DNA-formamidopyrimidine glycosylase/DNA-(apurinic or apyrimidinic site) lyase [Rhodocyclaceae bacterium]
MPELPEVETTLRGLSPHLAGRSVTAVDVRQPRLREPVPVDLATRLSGSALQAIERRGKYLCFLFDHGALLIHLGMSGSLRIVPPDQPPSGHDHVDIAFGDRVLRFRDPRRFGLVQWYDPRQGDPPRLARLGIEPLSAAFDGSWLYRATRGLGLPIKSFLMDGHRIVGVGNIYASESLFRARVHPLMPARRLGPRRGQRLASAIREVLAEAIAAGGSTLRDFTGGDGRPGYFQHSHAVYGREGEACPCCAAPIRRIVLAQRSTFLCTRCQRC